MTLSAGDLPNPSKALPWLHRVDRLCLWTTLRCRWLTKLGRFGPYACNLQTHVRLRIHQNCCVVACQVCGLCELCQVMHLPTIPVDCSHGPPLQRSPVPDHLTRQRHQQKDLSCRVQHPGHAPKSELGEWKKCVPPRPPPEKAGLATLIPLGVLRACGCLHKSCRTTGSRRTHVPASVGTRIPSWCTCRSPTPCKHGDCPEG